MIARSIDPYRGLEIVRLGRERGRKREKERDKERKREREKLLTLFLDPAAPTEADAERVESSRPARRSPM